jgi:hypothetical protein
MKDSKCIVAVNSDAEAPIFQARWLLHLHAWDLGVSLAIIDTDADASCWASGRRLRLGGRPLRGRPCIEQGVARRLRLSRVQSLASCKNTVTSPSGGGPLILRLSTLITTSHVRVMHKTALSWLMSPSKGCSPALLRTLAHTRTGGAWQSTHLKGSTALTLPRPSQRMS